MGPVLRETFDTMRRLNDSGRNHIWGYYVRNLIRPLYFSLPEHRVDLLVGNPPWLRYSKMGTSMQARYKRLAKARNLLSGALGASGRDLSTLFVTRAVELYLNLDPPIGSGRWGSFWTEPRFVRRAWWSGRPRCRWCSTKCSCLALGELGGRFLRPLRVGRGGP